MSAPLFDEQFLHRLERLALLTRKATAGQMQGERRSPKRGQSVEFADFRPYVAGDDFRRIDWNAYARLERFFIKLFVEEEDLTVHFLIDATRSMAWGSPRKLDYAARAAGALGYIALTGLDRVTVTALGGGHANGAPPGRTSLRYFPPARGKRQALALFTFLQALTADSNGNSESTWERGSIFDPAARLRSYAGAAGRPGPLLLFSDLMDDGWLEGLRLLASHGFEVSVVHVLAPEEVQPELDGDLKLLDSESMAEVEITADYALLSRYQQGLKGWRQELGKFCAARGMHYVPLDTSLPLEELLFAWMRRKGVLR